MSDNKSALLEALLGDIVDDIKKGADTKLADLEKTITEKVDDMRTRMDEALSALDGLLTNKPLVVNLGTVQEPKNQIVHSSFSKIIKVLGAAKRKEKNIMLVGGAGGGKTHLVKQIAESLNLQFYPMSVGLQTTKSDLLGFINANGVYMPSVIRHAYENGGVLLLDEFDAAHAGVVTILNSLLANGHASFPDKVIEKHKDFVCICACNTYGRGANVDYVGRNRLDGATLDRFIVINVDYDENLESSLTDNERWFGVVQRIRQNIQDQGIKMIVSPRASMDGADLLDAGFGIAEVVDMVILKGVDEDTKQKVLRYVDFYKFMHSPKPVKKTRTKGACAVDVPLPKPVDDEYLNIQVNFDDRTYRVDLTKDTHVTVLDRDIFDGSACITIGEEYTTYLSDETLYIKGTEGKWMAFDRPDYWGDATVYNFICGLKKYAKTYRGIRKIKLEITHQSATHTIYFPAKD